MPNKALSNKFLCVAVMLMFCLVAPQGEASSSKTGLEVGLAIGIGKTKVDSWDSAELRVPKKAIKYGTPTYIKNSNNTYTCYIKWRWHKRPAK